VTESSVRDHGEIQLCEPVGIRKHVDHDDPAVLDRHGQDREGASVRRPGNAPRDPVARPGYIGWLIVSIPVVVVNRAIAARLFISPKTASVHVSRILTKLDATTRTEAAALAHASGLVQPWGRDESPSMRALQAV